MGDQRQELGSAAAQFNDYVGTAAADDADAVLNARSLYQIAGLDRHRWIIAGIDVEQSRASERVTVYAFDRQGRAIDGYADLLEFGDEHGEVPVTAFHLDDPEQVQDFRNEAFKRMTVRLTARALTENRLTIDQHHQLRPQR